MSHQGGVKNIFHSGTGCKYLHIINIINQKGFLQNVILLKCFTKSRDTAPVTFYATAACSAMFPCYYLNIPMYCHVLNSFPSAS